MASKTIRDITTSLKEQLDGMEADLAAKLVVLMQNNAHLEYLLAKERAKNRELCYRIQDIVAIGE